MSVYKFPPIKRPRPQGVNVKGPFHLKVTFRWATFLANDGSTMNCVQEISVPDPGEGLQDEVETMVKLVKHEGGMWFSREGKAFFLPWPPAAVEVSVE